MILMKRLLIQIFIIWFVSLTIAAQTTIALPQKRKIEYANEFISITSDNWFTFATNGTGAANTVVAAIDTSHHGVIQHSTGTTTTGRATWVSNNQNFFCLGSGEAGWNVWVRLPTLSDGTNTYTYRVGFLDSNTGEPTDGVYARYTHSVNSGAWQLVARSNGTESVTNTSVTVVANTGYDIRCDVNATGTSVNCSINGAAQTAMTTNIPTGSTRALGAGSTLIKSLGTTALTAQLDWFSMSLWTAR